MIDARNWLLCLCFASAGLLAQTPAPSPVPVKDASGSHSITLRGRVIDLKTGEPIAKALVSIRARNLQTATDEQGRFELVGVAPGEADLYVSTVDYGLLKQRIQIDAGGNAELELLLGQGALKHTERITVTSGPFAPTVAEAPVEHSITNTELKNLSSVMLDDPIRAVQNMPGVAADNDWYAQFAVRGSGPAQIGVFVDGALMSAPFHGILDDRGNSLLHRPSGQRVRGLDDPAQRELPRAVRRFHRLHSGRREPRGERGPHVLSRRCEHGGGLVQRRRAAERVEEGHLVRLGPQGFRQPAGGPEQRAGAELLRRARKPDLQSHRSATGSRSASSTARRRFPRTPTASLASTG